MKFYVEREHYDSFKGSFRSIIRSGGGRTDLTDINWKGTEKNVI
ncbi:hypothetical protein SAAL107622_01210 [Lacicoccus alkaliphilus]|uniref:Uncharacterized protein n=1 Tax=Lacicoccus alkaliphilus DSM 16010 TaxID=1123231 RepID=A0A1M7B0Z6_9BACL|nr:hypothetical protein SAMN02745189_00313 [Salinicoccus alkaliphilus DSM 16010]